MIIPDNVLLDIRIKIVIYMKFYDFQLLKFVQNLKFN